MKQANHKIKALTGLRGLAAAWIVVYHMHETDRLWGPLQTLIRHGYLAVDLFFVLSGFLIARSYSHYFSGRWSWKDYRYFVLRRLSRIYPLYFLITCAVAFMVLLGYSRPGFSADFPVTVFNLLLMQGWGFSQSFIVPAWFVSVELASYLLFPLFAVLMIYSHRLTFMLSLLLVFAALTGVAQIPTPDSILRNGPLDIYWPFTTGTLIRGLAEFCIGLAAYRLYEENWVQRWVGYPYGAFFILLGLFLLLTIPGSDLVIVFLLPFLVWSLMNERSEVARVFGRAPLYELGKLSYAIYLIHYPLLRLRRLAGAWLLPHVGPRLADFMALELFYVSVLLASWLVCRWIEEPVREYLETKLKLGRK